jgi:hypothetical protein
LIGKLVKGSRKSLPASPASPSFRIRITRPGTDFDVSETKNRLRSTDSAREAEKRARDYFDALKSGG